MMLWKINSNNHSPSAVMFLNMYEILYTSDYEFISYRF